MPRPYDRFLKQADDHFDSIQLQHPASFKCKEGCHACCEPGISVLQIEASNIDRFIKENPPIQERLQSIAEMNPHKGTRCVMLDKDGGCVIYPVRPFICRSHGAPIAIAHEEYYQIDVCPLNFTDNPIEELEPESFFILDDWNEQLLNTASSEERISLLSLVQQNTEK